MKKLIKALLLIACISMGYLGYSQDISTRQTSRFYSEYFSQNIRGNNALTLAGGTSVMNGDFNDPLFEIYFHAGYKRYLSPAVNLNFTYHKFNLAYENQFNNGFMSFDLNLEVNLFPRSVFTPFIYAGGGLNAANYFETTDTKIQGGAGLEYLVTPRVGIKLFADYNYVFSDELDGLVKGVADDVYWRMAFGLNFYFGGHGKAKRLPKDVPTVIESNPIITDGN